MKRLITVAIVLALVGASCGDTASPTSATTTMPTPTSTSPSGGVDIARADFPRAASTDVTNDEITTLVGSNTEFALDLFAAATADGGNVLVSPYSIAAALTMTYAGARGETAAEMASTLHLALPDDRIHAARNELDLLITLPRTPVAGDDYEPFTIAVANSLWGHLDYPFLDDFLELLAVNYDAGLNLVDFVAATEESRLAINAWVEDQTNGRIEDLIPEGVITTLTRLVIVNAIWFKANWQHQFDPANTADGQFTLLDGSTVTVPMMRQSEHFEYVDGNGYQATRLRYAGDAAMTVILPDDGQFQEMSDRLAAGQLADIDFSTYTLDLTMPKWEFESEASLKKVLQGLGMVAAFTEPSLSGGADFTGKTEVRELFVHEVLHKAFIAVDEQGTEAAAATAVVIGLESAPQPAAMTIDRPFLFVIEHSSTSEVLFIGQVVDPG